MWSSHLLLQLAVGGMQNPREAAETLVALRQQQELLQKLVEQQEQVSLQFLCSK